MDRSFCMQKILNIDLPLLLLTAMILPSFKSRKLIKYQFWKVLLLQNPLNSLAGSEVISTYVYKVGFLTSNTVTPTANQLFNTVVSNLSIICQLVF